MSQPMNVYFAVFNVRRGERWRASRAFIKKWGRDAYRREILPLWRKGIMSIFQQPPNRHTLSYAYTIRYFVNKRVTA